MKINETDPLHKQIKALMYSMLLWVQNHGYTPVYFQVNPFQNFEMDYFGTGQEIEAQMIQFQGYPVVYKEGQCKLYCRDWVVLKVDQVIKMDRAFWKDGILDTGFNVGIRYYFVEERDDVFE